MAAIPDYAQAGELKIGQVGIANLRIRLLDVEKISAEMRDRVRSAPKLFQRAAIILDFGGLSDCPEASIVKALIDGLREANVLPVGIAYGTGAIDALSREVGLPVLAKFRASYESLALAPESAAPELAKDKEKTKENTIAQSAGPGMMHVSPVRSGQQIYAQNRDLTICASVGAGAEVIADGSIHIYGALRGRALAGAGGLATARIFCRDFNAELVAIAGTYKVLEEVPKNLIGKSVQIWLEDEHLRIEELA